MARVVVYSRMSLDGYFTDRAGGIEWMVPDLKIDQVARGWVLGSVLVMGRLTFELFQDFWPSILADPDTPAEYRLAAEQLEEIRKVVFSKSLQRSRWRNSEIVRDPPSEVVARLKQEESGEIIVASGTIAHQLADARMIDEYLLVITPVALGAGKPVFAPGHPTGLTLLRSHHSDTGNLLCHFQVR